MPTATTAVAELSLSPPAADEHNTKLESFSLYRRQPQGRRSHARQIKLGPYLLLQTLGEGEFGKVKLGIHTETGQEFAIKLIRKETVGFSASRMSKVEREIHALRTLKHPNIVKLFDVIETERYIGIILEYASGGELFEYILAHRALKEKDARRLFAQLISSVQYMHRKNIVHRDLKLENLLLDRSRNIVVTDFGFANQFDSDNDLMATSCGSPCYAAPELVVNEGLYQGSSVDIWSCGVILYAMLSGYLPFDDDPCNPDGHNINQLYRYILSTTPSFPSHISPEAQDLLRRMLTADPSQRCSLDAIQQHPWLQQHTALFNKSDAALESEAARLAEQAFMPSYRRMVWSTQQQQEQQQQQQQRTMNKTRPATVHGLGRLAHLSHNQQQHHHNSIRGHARTQKAQTARPPPRRERLLSFFTNNGGGGGDTQLLASSKLRSKFMANLRPTATISTAATTTNQRRQQPYQVEAPVSPPLSPSDQSKDEAIALNRDESLRVLTRDTRRPRYHSTVGAASGRAIAAMRNSLSRTKRENDKDRPSSPQAPLSSPQGPTPTATSTTTTAGRKVMAWIKRKSGGNKTQQQQQHQNTTTTTTPINKTATPAAGVDDNQKQHEATTTTETSHEPPKPEMPKASRTVTELNTMATQQPATTADQHANEATTTTNAPDDDDTKLDQLEEQMRFHHGAVDRSALTSQPPDQVMDEIKRTLVALGITHLSDGPYKLKCSRRKAKTPPEFELFPDPGRLSATSSREDSLLSTEAEEEVAMMQQEEEQQLRPIYGDPITDTGDEVRFLVEISRFRNLPGLYIVDIRRLRGSVWAYKFLYHKIIDLLHLGSYCCTTTTRSVRSRPDHLVQASPFYKNPPPPPPEPIECTRSSILVAQT